MRATARVLGTARVRRRTAAVLGLALSCLVSAVPRAASADPPREREAPRDADPSHGAQPPHDAQPPRDSDPRRDGPLVLRLAIENDNLLLGGYARLAGRDLDGTDLGRTHAGMFMVAYDFQDRGAIRLDLSTALYTTALDGAEPGRNAMVPVHFHELDRLRVGVALGGRRVPWRLRIGLAVEVSNPEEVTIGASGQQRMWHDFLANTLHTGTWQFEHRPSGIGVQVGGAIDARAGGRTEIALAPWLSLVAGGDAGTRFATIMVGSMVTAHGRVAAILGDRRGGVRLVLGVEQHAVWWIAIDGVMLQSTIDVRFDVGVAALEVALHRYDGDQNLPYLLYVVPNTTMTFALVGRI